MPRRWNVDVTQAIGRVLSSQPGFGAGSDTTLAAAIRVHDRLSRLLSQVIGLSGFEALFTRGVSLLRPRFALLAQVGSGSPSEQRAQIWALLEKAEPAVATELADALLTTVCGLLASFIGEELVLKLLHNAWPELVLPARPASEKK